MGYDRGRLTMLPLTGESGGAGQQAWSSSTCADGNKTLRGWAETTTPTQILLICFFLPGSETHAPRLPVGEACNALGRGRPPVLGSMRLLLQCACVLPHLSSDSFTARVTPVSSPQHLWAPQPDFPGLDTCPSYSSEGAAAPGVEVAPP